MPKEVWKYELMPNDYIEIEMPIGATILCFDLQGETACIWVLVNPSAQKEIRRFRFAGTGHPITDEETIYIGTLQMFGGGLVFHLFEVPQ